MDVLDRFLKYIKVDTQSDYNSGTFPSTDSQREFAISLADELKNIGLKEVEVDSYSYVFATLHPTIEKKIPTVGFIAHIDTSPDFSGKNINPKIIENYNGEDIVLNETENIILQTKIFPEVLKYKGEDIVVTDGNTLLGADDKAGVAAIISAIEYLINHPEIEHGTIKIAFTPDEEIGKGVNHFDVKKFDADFAYTIDGGEVGELQYENFNAASAKIVCKGLSVHPGYAKNKMINSILIANKIIAALPESQTPQKTDDYSGFYHLLNIEGNIERTELEYFIRDFDKNSFEKRKDKLLDIVAKKQKKYGKEFVEIKTEDQYYNMKKIIEPKKHIIELAEEAMKKLNIKPIIKPIRGGTDGARLSFMGLPTPNTFAGGHNFHGKFEFLPVSSLKKSMEVIVKIIELLAK